MRSTAGVSVSSPTERACSRRGRPPRVNIAPMAAFDVATPHGPARVHLHPCDDPRGALVLGHGAGGGVTAPDLVASRRAANAAGFAGALVEQPYRVAGRRSPAPAAQLDVAWVTVLSHLGGRELAGLPLVTGGRSSGARVACRTAAATGAVPTLVVQGTSDPFGMPPRGRGRKLVRVAGDHSLRASVREVEACVRAW